MFRFRQEGQGRDELGSFNVSKVSFISESAFRDRNPRTGAQFLRAAATPSAPRVNEGLSLSSRMAVPSRVSPAV